MPTEELKLDDTNRAKLDDIVGKMTANGEKDEDIQFVVNDFKTKYGASSPKPLTPPTGANGGIPSSAPLGSTVSSKSDGSELGSWIQEANPHKPISISETKQATRVVPITKLQYDRGIKSKQDVYDDGNGHYTLKKTNIAESKVEKTPSNFGEILKKADLGVINPDLESVKLKPTGGVEIPLTQEIKDKQEKQKRAKADENTDVDLLVNRTNVARTLANQTAEKSKQLELGVKQIEEQGKNLIAQYENNPTPQLEQQIKEFQKNYESTVKAYNRSKFAESVYERRILETSDSIKKLANDEVPDGFFSGLYSGIKDNLKSRGVAYDLATMAKKEQIQFAKDQALKAPTKEMGLVAEGSQMVGGVIPDVATAIGFSLAGMPTLGATSVAVRQGAQQASEDFVRVFNDVMANGIDDGHGGKKMVSEDEAYNLAVKSAGIGAVTGVAEGLAGVLPIGGKLATGLANKMATKAGKIVAEKAVDTSLDAGVAATMQTGRNIYDRYQGLDTKITEGVAKTALGEALLSVPVNTFSGVKEYSKSQKEKAVQEVFKAVEASKYNGYELNKLQQNLDILKKNKMISEVDYNELNDRAANYLTVIDKLPTELQKDQKAADLIIEKEELEAQKESIDKAFHTKIDERIAEIDNELVSSFESLKNSEIDNEGNPKPKIKSISEISKITEDKAKLEKFKEDTKKKAATLKKNTSPTNEKYGTVNRNDEKGIVDLTKEEYDNELNKATPEAGISQSNKETTANAENLEEKEVENISQSNKEEVVDVASIASPKLPTIEIKQENPFNKELVKLGYEQSDIDKMTMEQKQEIVINKTQAPIVESSAKVDSAKENAKQEKIAAAQAKLDEEIKAENDDNIQQQVDKEAANVGAVGDIAKGNEKAFTYDKDGNIVEAEVISKGKNTSSILINGKQSVRANTELFDTEENAQKRVDNEEVIKTEKDSKPSYFNEKDLGGGVVNSIPNEDMVGVLMADIESLNKIRQQEKRDKDALDKDRPNAEEHTRTIKKDGVKKPLEIRALVKDNGDVDLFLANGHHRLDQSEILGATRMPVVVMNGENIVDKSNPELLKKVEQILNPQANEKNPTPPAVNEQVQPTNVDSKVIEDGAKVEVKQTVEQVEKEQIKETEMLLNGEAEKRRKVGNFIKDGIEYVRNAVNKGVRGKKGEVKFAEGVPSMPFTYKLIEADEVQPSHIGGIRNQMHFIPEAQPKNRNDDGSKAAEIGFANNPRFNELGENTNAYSGAPIVNERNEVVQGNNRTAGLKIGYGNGNKQYKSDLAKNAAKFGLTKEQVEGMKNPILVREVAFSDESAIEFGNYDVKDLETGGKRRLDPIALVKRIPIKTKAALTKLLFSGEGTLNSSIRENSKKVLELISPFINQAQRNTLLKDGELSANGAEDLEAVIQQFLFDNGDMALPELFDGLSHKQKEGIRKSLPSIFSVGIEANLIPEIQNAILAVNQFVSSGLETVDNWLNQSYMFMDGKTPNDIYTPQELAITRILIEAKTQSDIVTKFKEFASAVEGTPDIPANLLEEAVEGVKGKSKEQALKEIFNVKENENRKQNNQQKDSTGSGKKANSQEGKIEGEQVKSKTESDEKQEKGRQKERLLTEKKTEGTKKPPVSERPLNQPRNRVDVAKIFRRLFKFSPTDSAIAARVFDAKATFMAKIKGITKEDYYKQYWFDNDGKGGLSQIIGEKGAENHKEIKANLEIAKAMEKEGKSKKEIFIATGWERTKDKNKWKYDLLDTPLLLTKTQLEGKRSVLLSELIDNKDLFTLYPELKTQKIDIENDKKQTWIASFDPITRKLRLNIANIETTGDKYQLQETIVHEVQHAIQNLEKFQRGGNPKLAQSIFYGEVRRYAAENNIDDLSEEQFSKFLKARFGENAEKWEDLTYKLYLSLSGEIESRNVENRLGLSDAERKQKMLSETEDIDESSKIYVSDGMAKNIGWDLKESEGRKGAWTKEAARLKRIISMYANADKTTAIHEILGHDFLDHIIEASATNPEFATDLETIVDEYIKVNGGEKAKLLKQIKEFNVENITAKDDPAKALHEWVARQAEAYMGTEKGAKEPKLARVFRKYQEYLIDLYNNLTGKSLVLPSKPMVEIFRKTFGKENFDIINDYAADEIKLTKDDIARSSEIKITETARERVARLLKEADDKPKPSLGQTDLDLQTLLEDATVLKEMGRNIFSVVTDLKRMYPDNQKEIDDYKEDIESIFKGKGEGTSKTGESVYNSQNVSDEVKRILGEQGSYIYTKEKLKTKLAEIRKLISTVGVDKMMDMWEKNELPEKEAPLILTELSYIANRKIKELKKEGKIKAANELIETQAKILDTYINDIRATAQKLNYAKVFNMMGVDGKLAHLKRNTDKLNAISKGRLNEIIKGLETDNAKAHEDLEYFANQVALSEEIAGEANETKAQEIEKRDKVVKKLTEKIAEKDKKINELKKGNYTPTETKRNGKKASNATKINKAEALAAYKNSKGLGQDIGELNEAQRLGYAILSEKAMGLERFKKEWNKLTGENRDLNELRDTYEKVRDFATKDNQFEQGYFDSDAEMDEAINNFNQKEIDRKDKLAKAELEREILKAEKEAFLKQMSDKDKEVKAKEQLKQREKEITDTFLNGLSQEGLWDKYLKANVGKIIGNLTGKLNLPPNQKALLQELSDLATSELNKAIDELMPNDKATKADPNYAQQLGDLLSNQDKLAEIFDNAVKEFAEKNVNNAAAQQVVTKLIGLKNPFSEKLLEKALEKEAGNYAIKIKDLAFKYAGLRGNLKNQIIDQIISESELQGAGKSLNIVQKLKDDLRAKFDQIISESQSDVAGQLATAIINDAKKSILNKSKTKDYVNELLGYLKTKAKDAYKANTGKVLADPFSQIEYAVNQLNDSNGRKIWEDSKAEINKKIDADKNLSQTEKDSLKTFLDDYQNTIFDQLLSKNKLFKNIQKELTDNNIFTKEITKVDKVTGVSKVIKAVDWNAIITQAKGNVDSAKQIIKDALENKLSGHPQQQVDNIIDAIGREFDARIKEKRVSIIEAQINSIVNPNKKKKKTIAKGKIEKLIEMENSGALSRANAKDIIGEWVGVKEMTTEKWARLRELLEDVENAPEGNERERAIDNASSYMKLNSVGRRSEIYTAFVYGGMLGRPTTIIKNATGISEVILRMIAKGALDKKYAKMMLQGARKGDFLDVLYGGNTPGGNLASEVDENGMPHTDILKGLGRHEKGIKAGIAKVEAKILGVLSATDAFNQAVVTSAADYENLANYYYLNEGLSKADARQRAYDELMSDKNMDEYVKQAAEDFQRMGVVPSAARFKRRIFEIQRNAIVPNAVIELANATALEEAYKSDLVKDGGDKAQQRLTTNRGVFNTIGAVTAYLVNGLGKGAGWAVGSVSDMLPLSEAAQKKNREFAARLVKMNTTPFVRGVSNVVEQGMEKTAYGMLKGYYGLKREKLNYGDAVTPQEKLAHEYMKGRYKDKIAKSAAAHIMGAAFYFTAMALSRSGDEDDEKEALAEEARTGKSVARRLPTGLYAAGTTLKWGKNNIQKYTFPSNCLVIGGRVIPLSLLGTVGIGGAITGSVWDSFFKKQAKEGHIDPDGYFQDNAFAKSVTDFTSSVGSVVLSMAAFQSISELNEAVSPNSNTKLADFATNKAVKAVTNAIPLIGTINQTAQAARYLSGDKSAQAAIGFYENALKEAGMAGILYNRPILNYVGEEVTASQNNVEGISGLIGVTDVQKVNPRDNYTYQELNYNPTIDKRLSEDFVDNNDVSMSRKEYDDFKNKTQKNFGKILNETWRDIKDLQLNSTQRRDILEDKNIPKEKEDEYVKAELNKQKRGMVSTLQNIAETNAKLDYQLKKEIITGKEYAKEKEKADKKLKSTIKKIFPKDWVDENDNNEKVNKHNKYLEKINNKLKAIKQ